MTDYPRPALTVDLLVFNDGKVLLIKRKDAPFAGRWALPGGYVNEGETVEQAAARELAEETGVSGLPLKLVGVFSAPGRDPRGWVVSVAFLSGTAGRVTPVAGDDAAEAMFVPYSEAAGLAFDHDEILKRALELWHRGLV